MVIDKKNIKKLESINDILRFAFYKKSTKQPAKKCNKFIKRKKHSYPVTISLFKISSNGKYGPERCLGPEALVVESLKLGI